VAIRFESLDLGDCGVLGVRLHGAFGRGDRRHLLNLADRCIKNHKTRLILDCRDLDSLGGSGAAVLADLQRQLLELDGELVFVSAGDVICRFLQQKFAELPLRCYADSDHALAAFSKAASGPRDEQEARGATQESMQDDASKFSEEEPQTPSEAGLDQLLECVDSDDAGSDELVRRTADLVTAAFVTTADVLQAFESGSNPTVMGEMLGMLLNSQDLAVETIYCQLHGDHYLATTGKCRVPSEGGIVTGLTRSRRPLTLLDLEDRDLWDEETQLLEDLQPDLILPVIRDEVVTGVAFLKRGGPEREYGISEIFALELLLLLLSRKSAMQSDHSTVREDPVEAKPPAPVPPGSREAILGVKLELMRGLPEAQDIPHFWQVFISRMREAAEVTSLAYLDGDQSLTALYLTGEARSGLQQDHLSGERIKAFFRTLERPVEIVNMPSSLAEIRNMLLACGLHWLLPMRSAGDLGSGILALGLRWCCSMTEAGDELQEIIEITTEALLRLREGQNRADMSLGLLEDLLVSGRPAYQSDHVTKEAVRAVRMLARELGFAHDQERDLVLGALLRNHGQEQASFDDLEADRLTGQDWELYRNHPDQGCRLLAALKAPGAVLDSVRFHHERFDGRGFPLGLKGRDIPLVARLVAVAQCYALHLLRDGNREEALDSVKNEVGRSLDPDLVEMFSKANRRHEVEPVQV
jgi:HD-GYP domain-containing protein (c-di-GMP phosphodiesterase class II)/anti-anti-sigma regulatory factor